MNFDKLLSLIDEDNCCFNSTSLKMLNSIFSFILVRALVCYLDFILTPDLK
jgi:hypothetical protein